MKGDTDIIEGLLEDEQSLSIDLISNLTVLTPLI
jgi:hypothetical protein